MPFDELKNNTDYSKYDLVKHGIKDVPAHGIVQILENMYIDELPSKHVDDFALGRLIGQQDIIRVLKKHLKDK